MEMISYLNITSAIVSYHYLGLNKKKQYLDVHRSGCETIVSQMKGFSCVPRGNEKDPKVEM